MADFRDVEKEAADKNVPVDGTSSPSVADEGRFSKDIEIDRLSRSLKSPSSTDSVGHNGETQDTAELAKVATSHSGRAPIVAVPRRDRRGLLAFLTVIPEVTTPTDYSNTTKWLITAIISLAGAGAPMGSAIIMPALLDIAHSFGASTTIANLSVAIFMLSMAIWPLWWSSFSESFGRRTILIVSFVLFTLWSALSAISSNIAMLVVFRTLSGGAASSVQAVGAGAIADVWEPKERGHAMGIFYLGPLCGPLFAPIIGGVMTQHLGWQSTQWFQTIYGGLTVIGLILVLPETLRAKRSVKAEAQHDAEAHVRGDEEETSRAEARPTLTRTSTRQSVKIKSKKWLSVFRRCFIDPMAIMLFLRHPSIALTVYYAAITFGSLYILNISIETTFSAPPYSYSTTIVGLMYIPSSIGYFLASILGGRWIDYIMKREAVRASRYDARGRLVFRPMDRVRENAWISAVVFPLALVWYGWTAAFGVAWEAPAVANLFFGVGSMLVFALVTTMLTEFLPTRAASGIALNNFWRYIVSSAGAVAAGPLISAIGNGWLFTILGAVSLLSGVVVIWTFQRYGEEWRVKMEKEVGSAS